MKADSESAIGRLKGDWEPTRRLGASHGKTSRSLKVDWELAIGRLGALGAD